MLSGQQKGQSHWSTAYFTLENFTKYVKVKLFCLKGWRLLKMCTRKRIWALVEVVLEHILGLLQQPMMGLELRDVKILVGANRISILDLRKWETFMGLVGGTKTAAVARATGVQEDQKLPCGCCSLTSFQRSHCYLYVGIFFVEYMSLLISLRFVELNSFDRES